MKKLRAFFSIATVLARVETKVDQIMATERDLQNDLDAIKTGVAAVSDKLAAQAAQIATLSAQVASGTPVTQDQLDGLHAEASSIIDALNGINPPAPAPTA